MRSAITRGMDVGPHLDALRAGRWERAGGGIAHVPPASCHGMKPRIRTVSPRDRPGGARRRSRGLRPVPASPTPRSTPTVRQRQRADDHHDNAERQHHAPVNGANSPTTSRTAVGALENATDFDPGPGVVNVPSNGTVSLVVNAGGGNDNVNVQARASPACRCINGGDGDDIILGTALVDAIDGGEGNDRITGFRGSETIVGGNGNDVTIWNNGDGNDTYQAGAGVDETLITEGNADDVNAITQDGSGRALRAHERGVHRRLGRHREAVADVLLGQRRAQTGPASHRHEHRRRPGRRHHHDGAAPDRILGDRGNDTVNGGGGDDTLVGPTATATTS